ncbi:MAG TPA: hypothetical protein VFS20_29775 [Longimicrobium sp.]|nr:hypothetical protein [Longimicrobium sp.]
MKSALRSSLATLFSVLAFACLGLGERGSAGAEMRGMRIQTPRQLAEHAAVFRLENAFALIFLEAHSPALKVPARRPGAVPRLGPGRSPSSAPGYLPPGADHATVGSSPHLGHVRRPGLARELAAAQDGTLSSRSTGLPPPILSFG